LARPAADEEAKVSEQTSDAVPTPGEPAPPAPSPGPEAQLLERIAAQLQACDLTPPTLEPALAGLAQNPALRAGLGNLAESLRQAVDLVARIAAQTPEVTAGAAQVADSSDAQRAALEEAEQAAESLRAALRRSAERLGAVGRMADEAGELAARGTSGAAEFQRSMQAVEGSTRRADEIVELIDAVALQTRILSINAGIEAARAGEAGRGFAVVATEIRDLSDRTARAAREVRVTLAEIHQRLGEGVAQAGATGDTLGQVAALMQRAGDAMRDGAQQIAAHDAEVAGLEQAMQRVSSQAARNYDASESMREVSTHIAEEIDLLRDGVGLFRLPADPLQEPRHRRVLELARQGASEVGRALQALLQRRRIDPAALFSREYSPIPRTEPLKHNTPFDRLCDEVLPALQEPLLAAEPWIVYAISANLDGYVPTHNDRFCKPLTGDPKVDLVNNRTKRIFSDRVGRTVGAHTDPYRLQVYRRDTGQVMFDLSVPIQVAGEHWGGFRIGYSLVS
jgi:methyl-accepting chemotaxis protein/methyl-accepting chemotaxis protein-2 (aspartate sensor receptor)